MLRAWEQISFPRWRGILVPLLAFHFFPSSLQNSSIITVRSSKLLLISLGGRLSDAECNAGCHSSGPLEVVTDTKRGFPNNTQHGLTVMSLSFLR